MDRARLDGIAEDVLALLGTGRQRGEIPGLGMAEAYAVGARIRTLRRARGEHALGRKIGFTNRAGWERLGVTGPMWSFVYDSTVTWAEAGAVCDLAGMAEPKIEPELVLGLGRAPEAGMDAAALLGCVDWVAQGFEIVQSVYPGWRMTGAEAVAAFGMHGALFVGPKREVAGAGWGAALAGFTVALKAGGAVVGRGRAGDVLGGPLASLGFLLAEIGLYPDAAPLEAGEIVTTGTLTDARPVAAGQVWSAAFEGVDLPGFELAFTDSSAAQETGPLG